MREGGFIGANLYVLAAVALVIAGLSMAVWGYKNKAEAAAERLNVVTAQRDHAIAAIKRSEAESQRLRELTDALNVQIVERDKRARALEEAKRAAKAEIEALKKELSDADKACLERDMPKSLSDWLRDS